LSVTENQSLLTETLSVTPEAPVVASPSNINMFLEKSEDLPSEIDISNIKIEEIVSE